MVGSCMMEQLCALLSAWTARRCILHQEGKLWAKLAGKQCRNYLGNFFMPVYRLAMLHLIYALWITLMEWLAQLMIPLHLHIQVLLNTPIGSLMKRICLGRFSIYSQLTHNSCSQGATVLPAGECHIWQGCFSPSSQIGALHGCTERKISVPPRFTSWHQQQWKPCTAVAGWCMHHSAQLNHWCRGVEHTQAYVAQHGAAEEKQIMVQDILLSIKQMMMMMMLMWRGNSW